MPIATRWRSRQSCRCLNRRRSTHSWRELKANAPAVAGSSFRRSLGGVKFGWHPRSTSGGAATVARLRFPLQPTGCPAECTNEIGAYAAGCTGQAFGRSSRAPSTPRRLTCNPGTVSAGLHGSIVERSVTSLWSHRPLTATRPSKRSRSTCAQPRIFVGTSQFLRNPNRDWTLVQHNRTNGLPCSPTDTWKAMPMFRLVEIGRRDTG